MVITVLVVGFALHWMAPSIPLTAALGPTDAAAVGALGSTVSLTKRQKVLLSGESLINDASGVVAGFAAFFGITLLRRRGLENNIVHVLQMNADAE